MKDSNALAVSSTTSLDLGPRKSGRTKIDRANGRGSFRVHCADDHQRLESAIIAKIPLDSGLHILVTLTQRDCHENFSLSPIAAPTLRTF